jgi:chromosome segregation ATPase
MSIRSIQDEIQRLQTEVENRRNLAAASTRNSADHTVSGDLTRASAEQEQAGKLMQEAQEFEHKIAHLTKELTSLEDKLHILEKERSSLQQRMDAIDRDKEGLLGGTSSLFI